MRAKKRFACQPDLLSLKPIYTLNFEAPKAPVLKRLLHGISSAQGILTAGYMFVDLRKQKDLRNSWWTRWLKSKTRLSTWRQSVAKVEHFPFAVVFFGGPKFRHPHIPNMGVMEISRDPVNVNHLLSLPFLDVHQDDKKIIYICTHQLCTPLHSLSASGCRCCLWSLDEIVKGCVGEG